MIRHRLSVPREDHATLIQPPPEQHADLLAANRRLLATMDLRIGDMPLADFRRLARRELLDAAAGYTQRIVGRRLEADPDAPLVASGHQPEFFHAGVWLKNFLLHRTAAAAGGVGLNLVVDNDALKHAALAVPVREGGRLRIEQVPFASPPPGIAFEEDRPATAAAVRRLRQGVAEALATLDCDSAFDAFAPLLAAAAGLAGRAGSDTVSGFAETVSDPFSGALPASHAAGEARHMGEAAAVARRRWEAGFGIANLELPVSRLAETEAFRRFVLDVLAHGDRVCPAYNRALAEYRRLHGIANRANPLPDLACSNGFHELPFWIWRAGGQRQRLEAQRTADGWELQVDDRVEAAFTDRQLARPQEAAAALADLSARGLKIRPRALTLTWFMRLGVCDAFIHGIGGAHYDTITDEILHDLYGITPPPPIVATGTLWMDLPRHDVSRRDVFSLQRLVRELVYNPQKHLAAGAAKRAEVRDLLRRRQELIARSEDLRERSADQRQRRQVFDEIRDANARLAAHCDARPAEVAARIEQARRDLDENRVAENREYFFALLPRRKLEQFLRPVAGL